MSDGRPHPHQSYSAVGSHPDRPRVDALFAPGAQSATAWLPDGTLWNGDVELAFTDSTGRPLEIIPALGLVPGLHPLVPATVRGEYGRRPPRIALQAFMPWSGDDRDTLGWTRLQVLAFVAPDAEPVPAGMPLARLAVRSAGETGHPLHPHAPVADRFTYEVAGDRILRDGRTIAIARSRRPSRFRAADASSGEWRVPKRPERAVLAGERVIVLEGTRGGDSQRWGWDVWLAPAGGLPPLARPPDEKLDYYESFARTGVAWRAEMERGADLVLPDSALQVAFFAARRLVVGNRERRNGALHFLGSPFQYRDLYLRDGARVVHALGLLGRADLAAPALRTLFEFQWPGGAFLSQRGQLDGSGQTLWALASYAGHGGDPKVVDALLPAALRAARWIALQRASSERRGGPAAGLLPYADPRDNELVRGHLLGNDAWALAGLEALTPLLRARGKAATADSIDAEAHAYRARLVEVWDRESRRQGRPLPPVIEGGGRDWGNLSAAYPCGVFAPGDARVVALDRYMRAHHSIEGLLAFGEPDSLHHYLGFDRTQAALRRGDRATFLADLAAILAHCQSDGTGFELASGDGGFGDNLPPHGTFAAMLVDLARASIAYEQGDSLVLLAGLAPLAPRDTVRLRSAPTRFGRLDVEVVPPDASGARALRVDLPTPALVDWPTAVSGVRGERGPLPIVDSRRFALPAGKGIWLVTEKRR